MRFKYKFLLLLILFIVPLNDVFASSVLGINCPVNGTVGGIYECELFGNSDTPVSAFKTNLVVSDNLEFVSFNRDNVWQGDGSNGQISLYTYPNLQGNFKIGIVSIKIKNDSSRTGTITLKDIYFYKDDFSKVSVNSISNNIKVLSTNNYLASLSLVGYGISPAFNKDVLEYSATVDSDVVVIEASSVDSGSIIEGIGTKNLNYGVNNFSVIVISEAGTRREYKLVITRPEEKKEEDKTIDEKVEDISKENDDITEVIEKEENKLEASKKDNDSKLKSLLVDGYNIDFNSDMYEYYIDVSSEVDNIIVEGIANSEKAKVEITGNSNLGIGKNEVIVTVTAEDGNKSIYTIYVTKRSDVCVVSNIKVKDYELEFDCNKYDYKLEIWDEKNLNIDVITVDGVGNVNIYNNSNLKHEDIIKIVVNVDGVLYKYNIKVLKNVFEIESIVNSKQLVFVIVILIFALLYFIVRLFIKKRHKKVEDV